MTPSMAWRPPRTATAIRIASAARAASDQVGELRCGPVLLGQTVAAFDLSGDQALSAHRVRDGLLADLPALLAQVVEQARRPVQSPSGRERPRDCRIETGATAIGR